MLKVNNLTFAYTKEYNTLQNISFELPDKTTMFIYGKQESGRSSLLRILLGIEDSFKGEVLYDNMPVKKDLFFADIAVGFIPERMACIENKSVYYNLEYVLKFRKVNKSIREVKVNNAIREYGLEVYKDTRLRDLGKLERIKVALARLSLRDLQYILVDDIFKDLADTDLKYMVDEIKKLIKSNDAAAIIVSDNLDILKYFKFNQKFKLEYGSLENMEN